MSLLCNARTSLDRLEPAPNTERLTHPGESNVAVRLYYQHSSAAALCLRSWFSRTSSCISSHAHMPETMQSPVQYGDDQGPELNRKRPSIPESRHDPRRDGLLHPSQRFLSSNPNHLCRRHREIVYMRVWLCSERGIIPIHALGRRIGVLVAHSQLDRTCGIASLDTGLDQLARSVRDAA